MKTSKQLEKHLKGIANHRRIDILFLVSNSEGITLDKISEALNCNFKTISGHTAKLVSSGLIDKKYTGRATSHFLSPYGKVFVKILGELKTL